MFLRLASCVIAVAVFSQAAIAQSKSADSDASSGLFPKTRIKTSKGEILIELNGEKAPVSTLNFVRYAESGFYDGTIFHRVMSNFMIQGGGHALDGAQKTSELQPPIFNEWQNGLKNTRGTIAMARLGGNPNSATSQFFINVVDNANLDAPQSDGAAYAVFGRVLEGMDVVDAIRNVEVSANAALRAGGPNVPVEPVIIESVKILGSFDRKAVEDAAANAATVAEKRAAEANKAKLAQSEAEMKTAMAAAEKELGKKPVTNPSGLAFVDIVVGDGSTPARTDRVEVHYTGWLTNGTEIDSSVNRNQPYTFALSGGVVGGWLEGVATMKVGGKRRLIIPPNLGYGESGRPPRIPPNSVLVFDIELLAIK